MIMDLYELINDRVLLQEELLDMTRFNDAKHSNVSTEHQALLNQQEVILRSYIAVLNKRIELMIKS